MSTWEAILLGIIQGLTEFLPISSSGHLVLAQRLLELAPGDLSFEVAVHGGTLLAVVAYFGGRIRQIAGSVLGIAGQDHERQSNRKLVLFLIVASIPAAVLGLAFKDHIEELFAAPIFAAISLMVTGIWLLLMRVITSAPKDMNYSRAVVIGLAQAAAMMPGISRSGSTIATGTMLGTRPAEAAEFSFLLSIPAVLGANLLTIPGAMTFGDLNTLHVIGAVSAAIAGYISIRWVFASLRRGHFQWFGIYCLVIGGVSTILLL